MWQRGVVCELPDDAKGEAVEVACEVRERVGREGRAILVQFLVVEDREQRRGGLEEQLQQRQGRRRERIA